MEKIKKYFRVEEFVCKHVYNRFKEQSWQFLDEKLLDVVVFIREGLGLPMYINNWVWGGNKDERGLRCNVCDIVKTKTMKNEVYMSAHPFGKAVDFNVKGMTVQEVRDWLWEHRNELPHPIRVEKDVTWNHVDVHLYGMSKDKITYFKG